MPYERAWANSIRRPRSTACGQFEGLDALANFYLQSLRPTTGEEILKNGDAIFGVMNQVGAGRSVLLGSFLGFSALAYRQADAGTDRFLESLLASAGVERTAVDRS